jgi:hypothetical protein
MDLRRCFANLPKESDVREPDEKVVGEENRAQALKAVQRNGGAAGIDRMTTKERESHLPAHWEKIRAKLLSGTWVPTPIYPDALDKEPNRRGHSYCRYADDCNICVNNRAAAERTLASIQDWIEKQLRLKVNPAKNGTGRVEERKFLGFRLNREPRIGTGRERHRAIQGEGPGTPGRSAERDQQRTEGSMAKLYPRLVGIFSTG